MVPRVVTYVNGVRIYPISVTVSAAIGSHLEFSVAYAAVPQWAALPPRSHIAVFSADPVSNAWRLLCEGETTGDTFSKDAGGSRVRVIPCKGFTARWAKTTNFALFGSNPSMQFQKAVANGIPVPTGGTRSDISKVSVKAYIAELAARSTFPSSIISVINELTAAVPVESYYHAERKAGKKLLGAEDNTISTLLSTKMFQSLVNQSMLSDSQNTSLEQTVFFLESLIYYSHAPLINPPYHGTAIGETLFIPRLNGVVPPACNVIFGSQIRNVTQTRQFEEEPTRVIASLSSMSGAEFPTFFVATSTQAGYISAEKPSVDAKDLPANELIARGLLSVDELYRGVTPAVIDLQLEEVLASSNGSSELDSEKLAQYIGETARYYWDVQRGNARTRSMTCTFLPYIAVGLPAIVDDSCDPVMGIVSAVTHTIHCEGGATTQVVLTAVHELYTVEGLLRTPPLPAWLNAAFKPDQIDATYAKLLGPNAPGNPISGKSHAAMLPPDKITSTSGVANLDQLAGLVVNVPRYTKDYASASEFSDAGTYASRSRAVDDSATALYQYQYRAGTSLSRYAAFHKLKGVTGATGTDSDPDWVYSAAGAPTYLDDEKRPTVPHGLFAAPNGLQYIAEGEGSYGAYTTVGQLSLVRQNIADTIRAAIDSGVTEG